MLAAINFHYVRPRFDAPFDGIHGVTPSQLEEEIRRLARVVSFVSGRQIADAARGRTPLPERAVVVTFDDGLREQMEHALPVLNRLGVPAMFFVNTAPIATGCM